ncbi:flagellar filament capping protein FliD [Sphingomonas carotinifaciens]|uniref:flagellar filament capping protein FliD n=1 Tax=Sphingomonas carotinifaciens TaxID=1166323 RepID=UPI000DDA578B|nr:flagellar filament capping protein FliD [Sphingomonas carotinifaciens]
MSTVTSTTTTPTTAATTTKTAAQSATSKAAQSLFTSLNTGSGVDLSTLVPGLVEAQFAARTAALKAKSETLTTQISAVAKLKSGITDFNSALKSLTEGGTLATQPNSSNSAVLTASGTPGAKLAGLSKSITVNALATAQTAATTTPLSKTAAIGTGTLTIMLGTATYSADGKAMTGFAPGAATPVDITIDAGNATIDKIAAKINAANAGVTASVVTNADGSAYLAMKGKTGAAQAFTVSGTGGLSALNVGTGATGTRLSGVAANAELTVDGIDVERASNTVDDLVDGVKLTLVSASPTPVTLGAALPTAALSSVVSDFVSTVNSMMTDVKAATDPITGDLRSDSAAKALQRSLQSITLTKVVPGSFTDGTPTTLAEIGVTTNEKTGALQVDAKRLSEVLAKYPDAVEAMFAPSGSNLMGLSAQLGKIQLAASSTTYGLDASTKRLNEAQSDTTQAQDKLTDQRETTTTRMTAQFASMNSKVSAYKSVQSFMDQQIKMWTKDS